MIEPNIHVRAARAHLERATRPTFIGDTLRGLLEEIELLRSELTSLSRGAEVMHKIAMPKSEEELSQMWAIIRVSADLLDRFKHSRGSPPSEDANIFAEWDDLDDALDTFLRDPNTMRPRSKTPDEVASARRKDEC